MAKKKSSGGAQASSAAKPALTEEQIAAIKAKNEALSASEQAAGQCIVQLSDTDEATRAAAATKLAEVIKADAKGVTFVYSV